MLPNPNSFGPPSSCAPAFAFNSGELDGGSLAIGLLGFLVGIETKLGFAAVLNCDAGVELTAIFGRVEAVGRVAGAVTKPSVGWMLLTLNTTVTSLPGPTPASARTTPRACALRRRRVVLLVLNEDWFESFPRPEVRRADFSQAGSVPIWSRARRRPACLRRSRDGDDVGRFGIDA